MPRVPLHWFDLRLYLLVIAALLLVLAFYNMYLGVVGMIGLAALFVYHRNRFHEQHNWLTSYLHTLDLSVKQKIHLTLDHLPLAMVVVQDRKQVLWCNHRALQFAASGQNQMPDTLRQLWPDFPFDKLWQSTQPLVVNVGQRFYRAQFWMVQPGRDEEQEIGLLLISDATDTIACTQQQQGQAPVVAVLQIDNYDEVLQGMAETAQQELLLEITHIVADWATERKGIVKKISEDKYIALLNRQQLHELEQQRFPLLDCVRAVGKGNKIAVTLSVGIAVEYDDFQQLGHHAQAGLDLALGRGGDQVVVNVHGDIRFYGGKTKTVEKTTRVKARMIAQTVRELMEDSSRVLIMGHAGADYDSLGACLGVYRMAMIVKKDAKIILRDPGEADHRLSELLSDYLDAQEMFIDPEQAERLLDDQTLVVIVDTHRALLAAAPALLTKTNRVLIIDHHLRAADMIDPALLLYLEPSASSTAELVTEMLQYFDSQKPVVLSQVEATALYAGIIVDTKNFAVQVGARTFEAAAYLRRAGADPSLVRRLFREDFDTVHNIAQIVENSEMVFPHMVLGMSRQAIRNAQIIAAKSADALLNVEGVLVSVVICQGDDQVIVSARSSGQVNVQVIVEQLGGGGHQTVAGAQLKGQTPQQVRDQVIELLQAYREGEDNHEGDSATRH